jgi:hypothetical protein
MPTLRATIADADGRRVPLAPHKLCGAFASDERSLRLHAASNRPAPPATWREWRRGILWGLAALPLLLAAGLLPVVLAIGVRGSWPVLSLAIPPLAALPALITILLTRRVVADRLARLHLLAGYCPSCAHDLGPEPWRDGPRHRCTECGAAWCAPRDDAIGRCRA